MFHDMDFETQFAAAGDDDQAAMIDGLARGEPSDETDDRLAAAFRRSRSISNALHAEQAYLDLFGYPNLDYWLLDIISDRAGGRWETAVELLRLWDQEVVAEAKGVLLAVIAASPSEEVATEAVVKLVGIDVSDHEETLRPVADSPAVRARIGLLLVVRFLPRLAAAMRDVLLKLSRDVDSGVRQNAFRVLLEQCLLDTATVEAALTDSDYSVRLLGIEGAEQLDDNALMCRAVALGLTDEMSSCQVKALWVLQSHPELMDEENKRRVEQLAQSEDELISRPAIDCLR
jgi:hypothetical protein